MCIRKGWSCHGNRLNSQNVDNRWFAFRKQAPSSRTWGVLVRANGKKCRVVFVTTEVAPWSKVGGLGDVMAALPAALAARGHRVMTVSPMYSHYSDVRDTGVRAPIQLPYDIAAGAHQQQRPAMQATDQAAQKAASGCARRDEQAAQGVEKGAAAYERAQAAESAAGDSPGASAHPAAGSSSYVHYHVCCSSGVDRVFVQHPLYHAGCERRQGRAWPAAIVSSYCHPGASGQAGGPDLAAAASVLCQAALAAPLLLWGITRGLNQQQSQQVLQHQVHDAHAHQQMLEMHLLMQLLGLEHSQAAAEHAAGMLGDATGDVAALLQAAAQVQQAELAAGMQYPQQIVAGLAKPVLLGTGGSEVDRRWPVCDLLLPRSQQQSDHQIKMSYWDGAVDSGDDSVGPLLFVANDWACGLLPLWLDTYRKEAQQLQLQQHNPHLHWLRQQQQAVFQLQGQPQSLQGLVNAVAKTGTNSDNSSGGGCAAGNDPASHASVAALFEGYTAVYMNSTNAGNRANEAQQLQQELQQAAGASSSNSSCKPEKQPLDVADEEQDLKQSLVGSSSWSAAAEAWLDEVGYQPESVCDAQLAAAISSAIAQGRVAPAALPAFAAAQAQLQQLLQQEQALGEAIQRLKSATIQLQYGATEASGGSSSRAAMYAAAANGSWIPKPQPAPEAAAGQAVCLCHGQELALLQQLLGRQLVDAKVAFAVHNFAYQGTFQGQQNFERLGLPGRLLSAFIAPVSQAARATAKLRSTVSSSAGDAVSVIGSQLAALGEALRRLGRCKAVHGSATDSSSGQSSSFGLLASVQELLLQASVQAAADDASVAAGQLQQAQQAGTADQQHLAAWGADLDAMAAGEGWQPPQQTAAPSGDGLVLNWMAAGVSKSDMVVTVSPCYAQELLGLRQPSAGSPQGSPLTGSPGAPAGTSMEALLAAKQLRGILNGLDTTFWDPETDPLLPASVRFSSSTVQHGKAAAKQLLQRRLGLTLDPHAPLFAFVGRLTAQKGVDVMLAAMPQMLKHQEQQQQCVDEHCQHGICSAGVAARHHQAAGSVCSAAGSSVSPQLVVLGAGERWMEHVLSQLAARYPGRAVGVPDFNEPLAHLIMAGADFLLVPSRFEPCGLVALAGLRYGALPIATATGGLADIVRPVVGYQVVNPGPEGDTAGFRKGVAGLVAAMKQAAADYRSGEFEAKRTAAMAVDVSWDAPCTAWEQLLLQLAEKDLTAVGDAAAAGGGGGAHVAGGVEVGASLALPSL